MSNFKILIFFLATGYLLLVPNVASLQNSISTSSSRMVHYEGRMDDINSVKMNLNCSAGNCSGELVYLKSGDRFRLQGSLNARQIELAEYDKNNQQTGSLKGRLIGNTIEASWENIERTIGNKVFFKEVGKQQNSFHNCGDNKWIRSYKGNLDKAEVELILQKVDNRRIIGKIYSVKENTTHHIQGELTINNRLALYLIDNQTQQEVGSLKGIYKDDKALNLSFYNERAQQSFTSFELLNQIDMNCIEYADYYSNYDLLFPKSIDPLFNQIMDFLIKDWIKECKSATKLIRNKANDPKLRASQRAYTWTEISFFKDNFLSGLLTFYNSWNGAKATKAFNYDFSNKASIELEDIFKKNYDYNSFIKKHIQKVILQDENYLSDTNYRAWIDQQAFSLFTICPSGLLFFTDFHSIYGRQSVLIPYKKIKNNIKKKSIIKRFF